MRIITDNNRKWWTLATVCFALFMIVLDGNVVALATPKIIQTFNATISQAEWVLNAYLLVFAVFLITLGRLGDMVGRRLMFVLGIIIFTIGSFLSGHANSINELIGFRVLQGFGGACMMPATISLISANFEKRQRGTALGIWGAISGLAIVAGPILGGYLTDKGLGAHINDFLHITQQWRYVFYINLPVGLLALLMTIFFIRESKDTLLKHRIDFLGIILSAISIFSLTFSLIEGQKYGWWQVNQTLQLFNRDMIIFNHSFIPWLFGIAFVTLVLFVLYEMTRGQDAMMDIKLFKNRNFAVGNLATTILSFAMLGSFFLFPIFLQGILGYSAIKTGEILLPLAITIMFAAPIAGRLADRIGAKWLVVLGMLLLASGMFYVARFTLETTTHQLIFPFIILGLGMGFALAPSSTITLLDIPPAEFGGASGVFGTTRQIGSVMGIAILGALLQSTLAHNITTKIDSIQGLPDAAKAAIVQMAKQNQSSIGSNVDYKAELMKALQNQNSNPQSMNNINNHYPRPYGRGMSKEIFFNSFHPWPYGHGIPALKNKYSSREDPQSGAESRSVLDSSSLPLKRVRTVLSIVNIAKADFQTQFQSQFQFGQSQSQSQSQGNGSQIQTQSQNQMSQSQSQSQTNIVSTPNPTISPKPVPTKPSTQAIPKSITPKPIPSATSPATTSSSSGGNFQQQAQLMLSYQAIGEQVAGDVKQSFVDSINHTFKIASLFALFGALVALLFKNKIGSDEEKVPQENADYTQDSIGFQELDKHLVGESDIENISSMNKNLPQY